VKDALGLKCSDRLVGKVANDAGIYNLNPPNEAALSDANIAHRLAYAKKYGSKKVTFWRNEIHFMGDGTKFKKKRDLLAARRGLGKKKKRKKGEGLQNKNIPLAPLQEATHTACIFVGMSGQGKITLAEEYSPPLKLSEARWRPIREKLPAAIKAAHPTINTARWLYSQDNDHAQNMDLGWFEGKGIALHKGPNSTRIATTDRRRHGRSVPGASPVAGARSFRPWG